MRTGGSAAEVLEDRHRKAIDLLGEGRSLNEAGRLLGCARSSVMRCLGSRVSLLRLVY